MFDCMNPCAEAVLTTIRTLEKEGHKCIEIDSNIFKSFFEIYWRLMLSINLNLSAVGDEHLLPDYNNIKLSYSIPTLIKPLLSKILVMLGERRKSFVLSYVANKSIFDYNHQCFNKIELSQKMEEMYKSLNLDAIISPVLPFPAFKHGQFNNLVQGATYSSIFNFFDYPTAVIPRVHIVNETDTIPENYVDRNYGVDSYTKAARENIVGAEGLPVGIQISTLTYQDEQCMGVAKQIDSILQKHEIIKKNWITNTWIIVEFIKIAK